MWIVLIGALIVAAIVFSYLLPSYMGKVAFRNASSSLITVRYYGTFFERGSISLAPGAEAKAVVFRGELSTKGYSFQVNVRAEGAVEDREASFSGLHPRDGNVVIVIDNESIWLIRPCATTAPTRQTEKSAQAQQQP